MRSNRYFLLVMLSIIAMINFFDRQILSILLESIKEDLELTDIQLGLLSGVTFAIFFAIVGIPIARIADHWDRRKIISISLFFWSFMTFLSGFATSFIQLALARIGVGVGEAGVQPASHSLIAEYFPVKERATAFAIYSIGLTVGLFLALSIGGWANDRYGWRIAFFIAGIPGMILASIAYFAIKESRETTKFNFLMLGSVPYDKTLLESFKFFWRFRSWRYAAIAAVLTQIATLGVSAWLAALIIRSYELSASETGQILAPIIGICGTAGAIGGGILADRLAKSRGIQWLAWTLAISYSLVSAFAPIVFLMNDLKIFVALLVPYAALLLSSSGVQFAIVHSMVESDMRAMSSALLMLLINLFGLSLGPLIVGGLSDFFIDSKGTQSLRYAMLCMTPFYFISVYYFYKSGKALPAEAVPSD